MYSEVYFYYLDRRGDDSSVLERFLLTQLFPLVKLIKEQKETKGQRNEMLMESIFKMFDIPRYLLTKKKKRKKIIKKSP